VIRWNQILMNITSDARSSGEAHAEQMRYDFAITLRGSVLNSHYYNFISTVYFSSLYKQFNDLSYSINSENRYRYGGATSTLNHKRGSHNLSGTTHLEFIGTDAIDVGNKQLITGRFNLQDRWTVHKHFDMTGNVQFNGQSSQKLHIESGLGFLFRISNHLKTSVEISQTVRHPTLYELYAYNFLKQNSAFEDIQPIGIYPFQFTFYNSGKIYGNSHLQPEKIRQVNFECRLQLGETFFINANIYYKLINDVISYQLYSDSSITFKNFDHQDYYGSDIDIQWKLCSNFLIGSIYNLMERKNSSPYELPTSILNSYLQYENKFFKDDLHLTLKLEGLFWDRRLSNSSHPYTFYPFYTKLPREWIINLIANFEVKTLKFFMSYENILDREYQLVYGYPMNGRTLHYGLRWEFWD